MIASLTILYFEYEPHVSLREAEVLRKIHTYNSNLTAYLNHFYYRKYGHTSQHIIIRVDALTFFPHNRGPYTRLKGEGDFLVDL